jgi:hypothetical protein
MSARLISRSLAPLRLAPRPLRASRAAATVASIAPVTQKCYFDITIGGKPAGKIVFGEQHAQRSATPLLTSCAPSRPVWQHRAQDGGELQAALYWCVLQLRALRSGWWACDAASPQAAASSLTRLTQASPALATRAALSTASSTSSCCRAVRSAPAAPFNPSCRAALGTTQRERVRAPCASPHAEFSLKLLLRIRRLHQR